MTAGVALHFILHWSWLKCMTRNLFHRSASIKSCSIEG
jgi:hypothetical protein